ncbi:hypothetical protein [Singulisphaera acidiphila]|uniref:Uncharacterized protein n=1 Tax=Singulisphaera acidiphila (strain ATCC BAA-1392 / DSM 18658 / VKM B-2454 / MOB10) TaxID=886293 RepID=L0DMJ4_SINAD|nr:hypothetical protein [Singulisphaera acidiphila]AGA30068.1 hypothetical protein Sinac_5957 [Singulisphaera acidiphila DSM 18658]
MCKARIHPRLLITISAAFCVMAWLTDYTLSSSTPPDQRTTATDRLQVLPQGANCQRTNLERVADESNVAAWDEDDEREEVRESIRTCLIVAFDHPPLKVVVHGLLISNCDSRGDSPGGRRGPPPRMPPA